MRLARATAVSPALVGVALAATLLGGLAATAGVVPVAEQAAAPAEVLAAAEDAVAPAPIGDLPDLGAAAARTRPAAPAPSPVAVPEVAPMGELRAPDLVVTVRTPLTDEQVAALSAVKAVEAVTVVDAGTVRVDGRAARVMGVDPSQFRGFTPVETASSDALWTAVARGELAPSHALARDRALPLGERVSVVGHAEVSARVGAVASYGLPGVDLVTDRVTAQRLGVVPSSAVVVSAPDKGIAALRKAVVAIVGPDAVVEVLRPEVAAQAAGKPTTYRELYIDSARYCPGLSWTVLAAIGQVESAHGKHLGPSSAGALGPMQFLPSTWAAYGIDGDGDGVADIMNPFDAVPSAAGYLCRYGARRGPEGLYDAIFAYNHADWYVKKVLAIAEQYR